MFDDKTRPMTDQILEEMIRLGYNEDEVDYARKMLKEKKDLNFAMNLAKLLATLESARIYFDTHALRNSGKVME